MILYVLIFIVFIIFLIIFFQSNTTKLSKSTKIILYYTNNCGWCHKFLPTWEKLKINLSNDYIFEEYECSNINQESCKNISRFPTIIFTKNNKDIEYTGNREYENILNYLKNN